MKNSTFNNTVSENSFSLKYAFKSLKKNKLLRYSLLAISLKTLPQLSTLKLYFLVLRQFWHT